MNKGYWLEAATSKIRFAPDRAAVRRELEDHLTDRIEANRANGMEAYEAEQAATAAMGDPKALAEELGRLHAPWWGYLQRATTAALVLVSLLALLALWENVLNDLAPEWYIPGLPAETETWTTYDGSVRTRRLLQSWAPEGSAALGQYRVTAPLVYLVESDPWTSSYDNMTFPRSWRLTVVLAVSTWKFWEPVSASQYMILDHTAVDSQGRTYARTETDPTAGRDLFCYSFDGGPFTTYFEVYFDLPSGEAPQWVEIPFGYGGDAVRVDLEKGAVS